MEKKNKIQKSRWFTIRCTEIFLRRLLAICAETGKSKTAVIEDLVYSEYKKNKAYEARYFADLEKKI